MPTTTLSRSQFETACKLFIEKSPTTSGKGWTWAEHASVQSLGYMSRRATLFSRPNCGSEEEGDVFEAFDATMQDGLSDDATLAVSAISTLNCRQYVVYSSTFQVPAFYFTIHESSGSPLRLVDIVRTSLFRTGVLPKSDASSFALSSPDSAFPLLSQGDHPTLGTPSWYFHPCETGPAVGEIMAEVSVEGWSEEQRLVRWMEAWFMVLGTVVDLRTHML
ncbi:hypothetical protein PLICRDRAFT_86256 [Plicaturopsis crispa FD-325 SS-3]|nr:hypothetical protein PLICRDRAFT_86256 [Plicaturopsis crispa FD-325 SS-3]